MKRASVVGRRPRAATLATAVLLVAAIVAGAACVPGRTTFPGATWDRTDPVAAGFDPAVLDEIAADAEANESNCFAVIRHGRLVADWYWRGTNAATAQEVFSMSKSVTSTLVGIAQDEGALDIRDRASDYIP